jgi:hypothetical protein
MRIFQMLFNNIIALTWIIIQLFRGSTASSQCSEEHISTRVGLTSTYMAVEDRIYVIGGWDGGTNNLMAVTCFSDKYAQWQDVESKESKNKSDEFIPEQRVDHVAFAVDSYMLVWSTLFMRRNAK